MPQSFAAICLHIIFSTKGRAPLITPELLPRRPGAMSRARRSHHRKRTFQDEYRAFLRRHNIEFDERYVWD